MGDHLHRLAQIVSAAFLVDDALVDAARGDAVGAGGGEVEEALIVPEIEIRLRAVVGDEHLAVLVGAHRARVDVDVGIKFLDRDLQATVLEQTTERCRRNALSER